MTTCDPRLHCRLLLRIRLKLLSTVSQPFHSPISFPMADLYPSSYSSRSYNRHIPHQYPSNVYPPQQLSSQHSASSAGSSDENHDPPPSPAKSTDQQKPDPKPQATFLTKLYAQVSSIFFHPLCLFFNPLLYFLSLLERPENHHMIRWDPAGEHIIVERPEQLALHVLPSIYRQSRFASFSRQLNVGLLLPASSFRT